MANATPSRLGQINQTGDTDALFLKIFGGEVLTAFEQACVFKDRHYVRTIQHGKSAQFPVTGQFSAEYHVPGTEITGKAMNHSERVITIDDLLIAHTFIARIDEAKNHYDVRSIYSTEIGRALSYTFDKNVARVGIQAARSVGAVPEEPGGKVINVANSASDSNVLASAFFSAAQNFDEKNVPEDERSAFLRPLQYYTLAQNTTLLNKWWGGSGAYADGTILRIAGIPLVKTNHLPRSVVTDGLAKYQGDYSKTVCLIMDKKAVGTLKLLDLSMESEYDIRRQGTLMVAKYSMGHGVLRPACAVEITDPNQTG